MRSPSVKAQHSARCIRTFQYAQRGLEGEILNAQKEEGLRLWRLEKKVAFMKVKQALIPHFAKFHGQSAALHAEIIRKLLAGEWNVEFIATPALRPMSLS